MLAAHKLWVCLQFGFWLIVSPSGNTEIRGERRSLHKGFSFIVYLASENALGCVTLLCVLRYV